jgi:CSLREA domain-containing protein
MNNRAKLELLALRRVRIEGPGVLGLALLVAVLSLAALTVHVARAEAATFVVNATNDIDDGACTAGHCSLREALNAANRLSDTDTINFDLGDGGHETIHVGPQPLRALFPVVIDGTTQPGYAGTPIVELDGTLSSPRQGGLNLLHQSGGSTVRGLVVSRFSGVGINLQSSGNYRIEGNYIGTDATGTLALGNTEHGIHVLSHPSLDNGRNTIVRNVISANGLSGIEIGGNEDENVIQGNYIGTNAAGTAALGNGRWGIRIANGPNNGNLIGGTAAGEGNVISANGDDGIAIGGACNPCDFTGNVVQGNSIGTNASGTAALGNRLNGISNIGDGTIIGGTAAGARNVISGNGWNGILIGGDSTGSRVQGNLIGTAADGTTPLGNGLAGSLNRDSGIDVLRAEGTTIGGAAPGAANTIAYSHGDGVRVAMGSAFTFCCGNAILSNSIHSNGGLGIDLRVPIGVTPNDPGDADRGPNELQNYPVLTSAGGNTIQGTLSSIANRSFRLEFFASSEPDASGHGEGERFLGATSVTTNGSGQASFSFTSPTSFGGEWVTATATDPANNTSEFSGARFVPGQTPSPTLVLSPPAATNDLGEEHCVTATVRDGSGNPLAGVAVRFSVIGANSASGSAATDANGVAGFCYTGTNAGLDTIEAYADTNGDSVRNDGEPADAASKTYVAPPEPPPAASPYLLLIDESSIDNGAQPNLFSPGDVNDDVATIGLRTPVAAFDGANVGRAYTLHTGQVGDEGWFAPKTIPATWTTAGPTVDGVRNFVGNPRQPYPHTVGPGLGTADAKGDRESLLDKVPDVTPLRATALGMLADEKATFCAVVYDSGIEINYGPLSGSLKGRNLGTVAFRVLRSTPLVGHSSGALPQVEVDVLDAGTVCEDELRLFTDAPEPQSSSLPFDTGRPKDG